MQWVATRADGATVWDSGPWRVQRSATRPRYWMAWCGGRPRAGYFPTARQAREFAEVQDAMLERVAERSEAEVTRP